MSLRDYIVNMEIYLTNSAHRFVKAVSNQVTGANQRGGEEKRINEEFKQKEEKKKELEQKALLSTLFKSVSAI